MDVIPGHRGKTWLFNHPEKNEIFQRPVSRPSDFSHTIDKVPRFRLFVLVANSKALFDLCRDARVSLS